MSHAELIDTIQQTRTIFNYVVKEMQDATRHERFFGASVDQLKTYGAELGEDQEGDDDWSTQLSKKLEEIKLKLEGTFASDRDLSLLQTAKAQSEDLLRAYQNASKTDKILTQQKIQNQFQYWQSAHQRLCEMTAFRERAVQS